MRLVSASLAAVTIALSASVVINAQTPPAAEQGSVPVKDGGIFVKGWTGKIDATPENTGLALNNAKLTEEAGALHVQTGPAVT